MEKMQAASGAHMVCAASAVFPPEVYIGIAHDGVTGAACAISANFVVLDAAVFAKTLLGFGEDVATFLRGKQPKNVVIVGEMKDTDMARRLGRLEGIAHAVTRSHPGMVEPTWLCAHMARAHGMNGTVRSADEISKRLAPAASVHACSTSSKAWSLALLAALLAVHQDFLAGDN